MSFHTKIVQLGLLSGLICFAARPALAQSRDTTTLPPAMQYNLMKKSSLAAGALEYLLPTAGHAYAGNWKRGILPTVVTIAGGATLLIALNDSYVGWKDSDDPVVWIGTGLLGAGRAWGIASAMHTATIYNKHLRERLHVEPQPNGRVGIRVDLSGERVGAW